MTDLLRSVATPPEGWDITARRRAEDAVRNALERLQAVLDSSVDAIITIDEGGTIESVNAATARLFGYSEDEMVGTNVSILAASPHREAHQSYIDAYLRTGEAKIIGKGREVVARRKDGSEFPADLSVGEIKLSGKRAFTGIIRDITERKEAEAQRVRDAQRDLVMRELNHRIANLFTIILTLVRNTARAHPEAREFERVLSGRLRSLAGTQALLTREPSQDASVLDLVRMELAAYQDQESAIEISGPDLRARDHAAQTIAMVVHELATNAVKYGALSVPEGRLRVHWKVIETAGEGMFVFDWAERDGPPVRAPERHGFGSIVTIKAVEALGGHAKARLTSEGLVYRCEIPLRLFSQTGKPGSLAK